MPRFLRMPKYKIRNFVSYPPQQKFAVVNVTQFVLSLTVHPIDASIGQIDVTVTSLPSLGMNVTARDVTASVGTTLAAPTNLRFV